VVLSCDPIPPFVHPSCRDHEVHVRMERERLTPGVQNPEESHLGTEPTGIAPEGHEGFGGRIEEKIVEDLSVVEVEWMKLLVWQGEDDVVVGNGKKTFESLFDPDPPCRPLALGAVAVVTGAVGAFGVAAHVAHIPMRPHNLRATVFDIVHHPALLTTQGVGGPELSPVGSKDIRHFMPGAPSVKSFAPPSLFILSQVRKRKPSLHTR